MSDTPSDLPPLPTGSSEPSGSPQPSGPPPVLTVIVVSYNTRVLTLAALRTLYATTRRTPFHTVVLDNDSKDGSADAIAAEFPQVELIRSADNLGFARANNVVAAQAGTEWLLLLNPDTECHEGAIDNLMDYALAHPEGGIYGGRTVFPDGTLNIASCWAMLTPWSVFCSVTGLTAAFPRSPLFHPEAMPEWKRDTVREVDIVVGCFFLIRKALWDRMGGFDLRYFMYGEEADLCARVRAAGYRPVVTPEAEIMHIVGAAAGSSTRKRVPLTKARITLIRDHWPRWQAPIGVGMIWAGVGMRVLASRLAALASGGKGRERAAMWSEIWGQRRDWLKGY